MSRKRNLQAVVASKVAAEGFKQVKMQTSYLSKYEVYVDLVGLWLDWENPDISLEDHIIGCWLFLQVSSNVEEIFMA